MCIALLAFNVNVLTNVLILCFFVHPFPCLSSIAVDRLQTHWEDSQTKLSDRLKQILNMLQDSTNWLDAKREVDRLIKQASERLESWQEITYTMDALRKQHADLRVGCTFIQ